MSAGGEQPSPSPPTFASGEVVRFVEPAGRRRARVGTVERTIGRGRHKGELVVRVAGHGRQYVLPPARVHRVRQEPAPAPPAPSPAAAPAPAPLPAAGQPLRLFP
jgi:hypothetical protein